MALKIGESVSFSKVPPIADLKWRYCHFPGVQMDFAVLPNESFPFVGFRRNLRA